MTIKFRDHTKVGKLLAQKLKAYANRPDTIVLAVPRGGVPVGFEVAKSLNIPLDICIIRKLGVPHHKELAMGAIAPNGIRVLNYSVLNDWEIGSKIIDKVASKELRELRRRARSYRGHCPSLNIFNCTVILVDDGIATGSTIRAAIAILQEQQPKQIIVAIPVAPVTVYKQLRTEVDKVICLANPEPFYAVGLYYDDFSQTSDERVHELLEKSSLMLTA
ncbi:MAG: phosphoribosyltransferase [Cyanobacteria bacterium J06639_18]